MLTLWRRVNQLRAHKLVSGAGVWELFRAAVTVGVLTQRGAGRSVNAPWLLYL